MSDQMMKQPKILIHKHHPISLTEGCPACRAQTDAIKELRAEVARLTEERDGFESDWRRAAATGAELAGRLVEQEKSLAAKDEALRTIAEIADKDRSALGRLNDMRHFARAALNEKEVNK